MPMVNKAIVDEQGHPHCPRCNTDLTGQPIPRSKTAPTICPTCRVKIFPDLRGRWWSRKR